MNTLARLCCTLGAALLFGCAAPGQPPAAPDPAAAGAASAPAAPPGASLAEWPAGLLPAVAEQMGKDDQWRPRATKNGAQATNTRHGLTARFDASGLYLTTGAGDIRLALAGIGRDGKLNAPRNAKAEVEGARVLYRHGPALTQWFINSPFGLEQGFTLAQKPHGHGELRLALALTGDLTPRLDNNELLFADTAGTAQLRYGALVAFDANGKVLPARMVLEGARLVLAVDDTAASYPIVIDPLFSAETKLTASDGAANDSFGSSVALAGDTALIGVQGADPGGKSNAGAAYVFVRSGGTWTQQAKLTASDGAASDDFGISVALAGDTALIGAQGADPGGKSYAGAAYVFVRSGTTWSEQAKLTASDGGALERFGTSVALSGDTALIGALYARLNAGAAYVFVRSGTTWSEQAKLTASDGAAADYFGLSVALAGDTALIGAQGADPGGKSAAGAAYVFVRSGTTWSEQAKLTASDGAASDYFGRSAALAGDTALIGAYLADPAGKTNAGAAYVFVRSGTTWGEQTKLVAADGAKNDQFGRSAALSGDTALVGAIYVNVAGQNYAGAAYLFGPAVDLALVKQDTADPVRSGDSFSYGLYVTNQDAEVDATGVTVTDTLPTGVSYLSNDGGCSVSGATVSCSLGALAKGGGTASVNLTVRMDAPPGRLIANTATASADQPNVNSAADTETTLVNTPPVAANLTVSVYLGSVSGTLPAADANGGALTFSIMSNGAKGTAAITDAATGAFTYTPNAGARGTDTFTFKVNDGLENSNTATVTVNIQNLAPVASNLAITAYEGMATSGTLPAADANGNALTFSLVANGTKGSATITNAATGAFTYTPNAGQTGADTFTFKAHDGTLDSNTATVSITINALPAPGNAAPLANDLALVAYESAVSGTLPASDANGDALTFAIIANGAKGVAVITNAVTGAFTYTPSAGQTGADSFTFQATDSHGITSNTATVSVTINALPAPGNAAPIASGASLVTYESTPISGILAASDANGDTMTFAIVANGAKGVASITDAATGAFAYMPHAGQTGVDSFTFQATDSHGATSTMATVSISINAIPAPGNVAPIANPLTLVAYQGSSVTGTLSAADANGNSLTFALVATGAKGTAMITNAVTGAFTYTPHAGETGSDTFSFQANDGSLASNIATVTVTINPLPAPGNVAPVANNLALATYEGIAITSRLPAADANGDTMTFGIVANGGKGIAVVTDPATGAFTYTPTAGETGTDSFTFQATDSHGAVSNTATITLTLLPPPPPGNSAPVANGLTLVAYEGSALSGVLSAADANGDALTFSLITNGVKGTAVIANTSVGAFTYTPNAGQTGTDTFTFKANDGAADSNTATVTVTINPLPAPGNAAPVASDLTLVAYADSQIVGTLAAADANADALTFTLVANGTQGTAVITDPAAGAFTYTPAIGQTGTDTFTFQASDGTLNSNTATVRITLLAPPASEQPTAQHTGGGGGALSPLALLLGLAGVVRSRRRAAG